MPYQADGTWDGESRYQGASPSALAILGESKAYVLVYREAHGVNCFFLRKDVVERGAVQSEASPLLSWPADMGVEALQRPPNYFSLGWRYPHREGERVSITQGGTHLAL